MKILSLALALAAPVVLGGCADYLNNRDTVTFGAGDAQAFNRASHVVDPWNRDSHNTAIASDGQWVDAAQRRRLILVPAGTAAPAPAASP